MEYIKSKDIFLLMRDIMKLINPVPMEHGSRVAYIVYKMLQEEGKYEEFELADIVMVASMHDIGAYKTEKTRISDMLQYETKDNMAHSIYGYLFFKYLSPVPDLSKVIMYHHRDYEKLKDLDYEYKDVAAYVNIAEKIDVYARAMGEQFDTRIFQKQAGVKLSEKGLRLFYQCDAKYDIQGKIKSGEFKKELDEIVDYMIFNNDDKKRFLEMLMYCLGFVNQIMVLDTVTVACICDEICQMMYLTNHEREILYYSTLIHDIGMLAIPQEIVWAPRKLKREEMRLIQTHLKVAEGILNARMNAEVVNIALAHHERGDGSGYPNHVKAEQISLPQGILQLADMLSAMASKRSYREAMPKERVIMFLNEDAAKRRLKPQLVSMFVNSYDEIMERVRKETAGILKMYQTLNLQYQQVCKKYNI